MRTLTYSIFLVGLLQFDAVSMDTERASSQRFKVACVEDKKLPPLTVISKDFDEREELLQFEKRMVAAGTKEDEMEAYRRDILRSMYFPTRITDTQTGNTYEVQKDRRTIIAKDKGGNYPAFQPFTPDAPPNSKIVIRGLRTHWIPH